MSESAAPWGDSGSRSRDILRAIDEDEARRIADDYLQRLSEAMHGDMDPDEPDDCRLIIVAEHTIEKPYGWVFFYDTEEHHLYDTPGSGIGGNAPFLVEKMGGGIRVLDGRQSVKRHLAEYERTLPLEGRGAQGREPRPRGRPRGRRRLRDGRRLWDRARAVVSQHGWATRYLRVGQAQYADAASDFEVLGGLQGSKVPPVGFEARRGGDKRYVLELIEHWLVRGAEWKDVPLPPRTPRRRDR